MKKIYTKQFIIFIILIVFIVELILGFGITLSLYFKGVLKPLF